MLFTLQKSKPTENGKAGNSTPNGTTKLSNRNKPSSTKKAKDKQTKQIVIPTKSSQETKKQCASASKKKEKEQGNSSKNGSNKNGVKSRDKSPPPSREVLLISRLVKKKL